MLKTKKIPHSPAYYAKLYKEHPDYFCVNKAGHDFLTNHLTLDEQVVVLDLIDSIDFNTNSVHGIQDIKKHTIKPYKFIKFVLTKLSRWNYVKCLNDTIYINPNYVYKGSNSKQIKLLEHYNNILVKKEA